MKDAYDVILAPLITEKLSFLGEADPAAAKKAREARRARKARKKANKAKAEGKDAKALKAQQAASKPKVRPKKERGVVVAFRVAPRANKIEIRKAIEQIWKVEVLEVRTLNFRGKAKRLGRFVGRRPSWKKAYVTLGRGQTIPEFS